MTKPAFIPLKREYYEAFRAGVKTTEYRKHGGRWTLKNYYAGRPVTLSLGYGKLNRLHGMVKVAWFCHSSTLPESDRKAVIACYGQDIEVLCIGVEVRSAVQPASAVADIMASCGNA